MKKNSSFMNCFRELTVVQVSASNKVNGLLSSKAEQIVSVGFGVRLRYRTSNCLVAISGLQ